MTKEEIQNIRDEVTKAVTGFIIDAELIIEQEKDNSIIDKNNVIVHINKLINLINNIKLCNADITVEQLDKIPILINKLNYIRSNYSIIPVNDFIKLKENIINNNKITMNKNGNVVSEDTIENKVKIIRETATNTINNFITEANKIIKDYENNEDYSKIGIRCVCLFNTLLGICICNCDNSIDDLCEFTRLYKKLNELYNKIYDVTMIEKMVEDYCYYKGHKKITIDTNGSILEENDECDSYDKIVKKNEEFGEDINKIDKVMLISRIKFLKRKVKKLENKIKVIRDNNVKVGN